MPGSRARFAADGATGKWGERPEGALVGVGSTPTLTLLTAAIFALALLLGGGTQRGLWSDAIVQVGALLLLGVLLPSVLSEPTVKGGWSIWGILAALVLLPLLQLFPLPPVVWMSLPDRASIAIAYREAGVGLPWLPISVDPAATWRSLLSLLPALAVFLATQRLGWRARRSLSLVLIIIGMVSVLLGLAQVMQGPDSALRFFPFTHSANSVGFFANRNHYAALLYSLIPLVTAWIVGLLSEHRPGRAFWLLAFALSYAALLLGLGMALSRAGMVLAIVAAVSSLMLVAAQGSGVAKLGFAFVGGAIVLGAILVVEFALFNLLGRFDDGVLADYRFRIAQVTIEAAKAFQPIGSGFGTFVPVYQMFEKADALIPPYINHAHDDWLEIWLEGGYLALAALLGFLVWFVNVTAAAWRRGEAGKVIDRALTRAASLVVLLLMLHSVVDYPLRTTALMTLFAFCCALLIPPVRRPTKWTGSEQKIRPARAGGPSRWASFFRRRRTSQWQTGRFS